MGHGASLLNNVNQDEKLLNEKHKITQNEISHNSKNCKRIITDKTKTYKNLQKLTKTHFYWLHQN